MSQGKINDEVKSIESKLKAIYNKVKITIADIENVKYLIARYKELTNWEERKLTTLVAFEK